jgi:antitoxin component YwqK of YwqJK toxin-antitoxin module
MLNGVGREFYENGQLTEEVNFNNDKFHGTRKYFYPNGHLWIEQVFKDGLDWEIVANYTEDGKRRDAGTLKNGNGTVIYYNEDGTVREVSTFVQGEQR